MLVYITIYGGDGKTLITGGSVFTYQGTPAENNLDEAQFAKLRFTYPQGEVVVFIDRKVILSYAQYEADKVADKLQLRE